MNSTIQPLNNAQRELLALFSEGLNKEELEELRKWLLEFRYKQLQRILDKVGEEKGWTKMTFEEWGDVKFRKPYKSQAKFLEKVADESSD